MGVEIPLHEKPPQFQNENRVFTDTHIKFVDEEIQKLLNS